MGIALLFLQDYYLSVETLLSHKEARRDSLWSLCADAFVLSKEASHEVHLDVIGSISFEAASVSATWQTRAGGTAVLKNRIMRFGKHVLRSNCLSLELYEHPGMNAFELHKYINITKPTDLEVYKIIIPVSEAIHDGHINQRHLHDIQSQLKQSHAQVPTPEDINLLYDELARGASGLYTPDSLALAQL